MAHKEQQDFFQSVKDKFPDRFKNVSVIDCGSLDINGSLRDFFENPDYLGVDIAHGRGVDLVCKVHELNLTKKFDVVVSSEMLEHDEHWRESLAKMYDLCRSGGLIVISAAGEGRSEHGTRRTGAIWGTSGDYYMNILEKHIKEVYNPSMFTEMEISHEKKHGDIYFWGIKK